MGLKDKKGPIYHLIASQPGGRKKTIPNKTSEQVLTDFVIPFESSGTITAKWGSSTQTYQVLELSIFKTNKRWDKKTGVPLEEFIGSARNVFNSFQKKAQESLGKNAHRVFIIMPIQGERFGTQNDQRIFKEYDDRFEAIEAVLSKMKAVAIRIDKEFAIEELVKRIKTEISQAKFVIADLTDERPSCYFEAGYAEALKRRVIYIASKESVVTPGVKTKIHFDIHQNVHFFTNLRELKKKLKDTITKNSEKLFKLEARIEEPSSAL